MLKVVLFVQTPKAALADQMLKFEQVEPKAMSSGRMQAWRMDLS